MALQSLLPAECSLKFEEEQDVSAEIKSSSRKKLPAKIYLVNNCTDAERKQVIDKATLMVDQYNTMQDLRGIFYHKNKKKLQSQEKIAAFNEAYTKPETQTLINKDIGWTLKKMLMRLGRLLSKTIRGDFKFSWFAPEPVLIKEMITTPSYSCDLATKLEAQHRVLNIPRRCR